MVKKKLITKSYFKEIINTIKKNRERFFSIVCIIALGVGFYVGMKSSSPDMKYTVSEFSKRTEFMDLKVISEIGLTEEEISSIKENVKGVIDVEGGYELQLTTFIKENESVVSVHSYNPKKKINNIEIIDGRFPKNNTECIVEQDIITAGYKIGETIKLNDNFKVDTVKIVGVIRSPLYISINKGSSLLLSGKINYYMYVPENNFKTEYYTTAYLKNKLFVNSFGKNYYKDVNNIKEILKKDSKKLANKHLSDNLNAIKKEIKDAENSYNNIKNSIYAEINENERKIEVAEEEVRKGYNSVKSDRDINNYLNSIKAELDKQKANLDKAKLDLDNLKKNYNNSTTTDSQIAELEAKQKNLNTKISNYERDIENNKKLLENYQNSYNMAMFWAKTYYQGLIDSTNRNITNLTNQLNATKDELSNNNKKLEELKKSKQNTEYSKNIQDAENNYNNLLNQYNSSLNNYNYAAANMKRNNDALRQNLDNREQQLKTQRQELEKRKTEAEANLNENRLKIDDAKDKLALIEDSDWHIYTRTDNAGYSQYSDDVERVSNLAKIFPIIFFLVAALVTLTSLSRMIDEERTQIGTLKAFGYTNMQILIKYLSYAFFSTFIGSIIGILVGSIIIPTVVFKVYQIMYLLPDLIYKFNIIDSLIGTLLAMFSTICTAYLVCRATLKETPSKLMKPKAQKITKKTILEYLPFFWGKKKLRNKLIFRNIFSQQKRLIMTIFGVAGCVSLIVAGFSLRHAVGGIVPTQYGGIFEMDAQIFFKDDIDRSQIIEENERIQALSEIKDTLLSHIENIDIKDGLKTYNIFLVVPSDSKKMNSMINIKDYNTGKKFILNNDGVIISNKIAELLNLKIGDKIKFMDNNGRYYEANISYITENYVDHYIYMTPEYFEEIKHITPRNNMLLVKIANKVNINELSKKLNETNKLSSITFVSIAEDAYRDIMKNLNLVVIVIIVSAVLLAFMVLYNLVSINLSERKTDIATIKVLGFKKSEVDSYIKTEMKILSYVGIAVGLLFSKYLATLVIETCEVDNLMFNKKISIDSYIVSIVITLFFLNIVDKITDKEIKKVDMVDSLKTLE